MHLLTAGTLLATLMAATSTLAQNFCPIVTRTQLAASCNKRCGNSDCLFVTTVQNPCGCPASVPTATLLAPCQADCPYGGCGVEVHTLNQPCQPSSTVHTTSTTTSRRRTRTRTRRPTSTSTSTSTSRSTSTSTTRPIVTTGVTTLPPRTTTTPCPTVTRTTQPADCPVMRCPVPNCVLQEQLSLPCGCAAPRTLLYVQGCPTACPEGCMTRTTTVSAACATGL